MEEIKLFFAMLYFLFLLGLWFWVGYSIASILGYFCHSEIGKAFKKLIFVAVLSYLFLDLIVPFGVTLFVGFPMGFYDAIQDAKAIGAKQET